MTGGQKEFMVNSQKLISKEANMKIAILSNFMDFTPGYSLTGIVSDQVRMLSEHGHVVRVFVNEKYGAPEFGGEKYPRPHGCALEKKVPFAHLTDYRSMADLTPEHKLTVNAMRKLCVEELSKFDIVFTHDLVFTGWNMPYAMGIQAAARHPSLKNTRWLHWIHSVPSLGCDWWNIGAYGQYQKLVFPNKTDQIRVAEQYRGHAKHVRVIPHIKDPRTWFDFSEETCKFIHKYPEVLQNDIVQILPASVDRLETKRVREVILIFSKLKSMGFSVCLVVANQWATGTQEKQDVNRYKTMAKRNGLVSGEFIFTSDLGPEYEVGIPKRMVRELFQLSNLFIFPTREESFGLVVPEASLAGGVLLVLNKSLQMQIEISGMNGLYFDFGSFTHTPKIEDEDAFLTGVAHIILGRMRENESILAKSFMRQHYNYDALYHRVYGPVMEESACW